MARSQKVIVLAILYLATCTSSCPNIISRRDWGAATAKARQHLRVVPPPFVVVHHSDTPECQSQSSCKNRVKNIQSYHMNNKGWKDIGYNFLVGGDGSIYEGRGWGVHGSHAPSKNANSIGICLIGNYTSQTPPQAQLDALKNLIRCGVDNRNIAEDYQLIGHRQASSTSCPGNKLYNEITSWQHYQPRPQ